MLFRRFRQPQWQHSDPATRRQAVTRLSATDADQAEVLRRLAVEDGEASVRVAAVKRLTDPVLLRRRMAEDGHATVREAARARYGRLLAGGCDGWDLTARLAELNGCDDTLVLAQVARRARDEAMRAAALSRLSDDNVLEEAALHDPVARVRQLAVDQIGSPGVLSRLAESGNVGDRRIARLARQRLEACREQARRVEQGRAEAARLCDALEDLAAASGLDRAATARRQRLQNRWNALGEAPTADQAARFQDAMTRLEARLGDVSAEPEVADEPAVTGVADALEALDTRQEPDPEAINAVERALAAGAAADEGTRRAAAQRLDAVRRYLGRRDSLSAAADQAALQAIIADIDWPDDLAQPPILRQACRQATRNPEVVTAQESAAPDENPRAGALEDLTARLSSLEADLDVGRLRAARRDLQQTRRAADAVPGGLPPRLERRLARAAARVAEWRDWRHFAVLPKQEALCEAMEQVADDGTMAPPERAERIRTLQRQWKATGGSDSPQSRALWRRFSDAAERAFESCREYFDAEAEQRQRNLAERQRIADQLDGFLGRPDWAETAAGQLDRIRRTARREWQAAIPVDRAGAAPVSRRFEAAMDRLTEVIEAKRSAAGEQKKRLIAEVEGLAEAENPEQAAEAAKELQQAWKAAGSARPSQDRALWQRFRAACDVIFERRDEARRENRGREAAVLVDGEAVCERLEALTNLDESDAVRRDLDALAREFRALRLPGAASRVRTRWDRAERAAHRHLDRLAARDERAEVDRLLAAAPAGEATADSAAQARFREIAVRLEILAGLSSPKSDEPMRMSQQVERLNQGMGEGVRENTREEARRLLAEWAAMPGSPSDVSGRVQSAVDRLFPAKKP